MFDLAFGHNRIKTMLANMVRNEKVHHGLLFHGPNGIGKRLTGRELALAMLCEQRTACRECKHCRKFVGGNHPDYREISPDGASIKVNQIREISENLHFKPFEARVRVIVIDEAHKMGEEAANAFLKSLEEPPPYVYFILVTSEIGRLLPTIISRCQKIPFQNLSSEDRCNILQHRFEKTPEMAAKLAEISFQRLETDDESWNMFREDVSRTITYLQMMAKEGHALDLFSDIARDKQVWPRYLDHLIATLRACTMMAHGLRPATIFEEFEEPLMQLVKGAPPEKWRDLLEFVMNMIRAQNRNINSGMWLNAASVTQLGLLEKSEQELRRRMQR